MMNWLSSERNEPLDIYPAALVYFQNETRSNPLSTIQIVVCSGGSLLTEKLRVGA
jgi:hypothetical protein